MSTPRLAVAVLLALGTAAGAGPPGGGSSQAGAEVSQLLEASAQPLLVTVAVDQGGSSGPETLRLDVLSNLAAGYAAAVRRTAFLGGDLTVRLAGDPPADARLVLDLPTAWTTLPPGPERAFGHRAGTISEAAGDRWRARLVVGPVGCASTGLHAAALAFTVRAGARTEIAPLALVVNVRRNRRLCG